MKENRACFFCVLRQFRNDDDDIPFGNHRRRPRVGTDRTLRGPRALVGSAGLPSVA